MKKYAPIAIVVAAILIIGGIGYAKYRTEPAAEVQSDEDVKVVVNMAMPGKEVVDADHGKEVFLGVGAVEGASGRPANGVVTLHGFADGSTIMGAQVNLHPTEDGAFYEGWLGTEDGKPMLSIGHLTNPYGDARHQVRFQTANDLRANTHFFVTREADDGNPSASLVVAKGVLKHQKR